MSTKHTILIIGLNVGHNTSSPCLIIDIRCYLMTEFVCLSVPFTNPITKEID